MICDSHVVYGYCGFLRHPGTRFRWWFLGRLGLSFRQRFLILTLSMGAEDFYVSLELGSGVDLWVGCTQFLSMIRDYDAVYRYWGFLRHPGTRYRWWFLGLLGLSFRQRFLILTQSMGAEDFCVSPELGSGDDLWVGWDSVFVNDLWFWRSIWALKISASARNLNPVMFSRSVGTQFS